MCSVRTAGLTYGRDILGTHEPGNYKEHSTGGHEKVKAAISLFEEMLKKSAVVGFDESGCYNNKKLNWAWIAQTAYITLCFRATGRSSKVLEDKFGESLKTW
nr:hypothetical protein [Prevotella corporis]